MAELAVLPACGMVAEIARPYEMADLVRGYLQATDRKRRVISVKLPGRAAKAVREGAVTVPGPAYGRHSWEEFLRII